MQSVSRRPSGHPGLLFIPFVVVLVIFVAVAVSPLTAGPWQGEEITKDGVVHVLNPETPIETPLTIPLEELWRLGGDSESDEEFFDVIGAVASESGSTNT